MSFVLNLVPEPNRGGAPDDIIHSYFGYSTYESALVRTGAIGA